MNEEKLGEFGYYVKVTAIGGEVYWTSEKAFLTECGESSSGIDIQDITKYYEYTLDPTGSTPLFEID